jgi:hypothetical protein
VAVGGWGIQPSEFWGMDAEEWWWLYDAKRPRDPRLDFAGSLDEATVKELSDWLEFGD